MGVTTIKLKPISVFKLSLLFFSYLCPNTTQNTSKDIGKATLTQAIELVVKLNQDLRTRQFLVAKLRNLFSLLMCLSKVIEAENG